MAEEDRISALPESLLLHILSFLSIKEIVRTCLLSQRWQLLWTDISEIHLVEESDDIGKIHSFVDWVGKMLVTCNGICLNKFSVDFVFHQCFASSVNLWVQFLVKNKVKNITLFFYNEEYKLPQMLYSHSSLTSLTLRLCDMAPRGDIKWGFLKKLSLEIVVFKDLIMEKILSGCPVLESLYLRMFGGFNRLNITSPSLTTLVIEDFYTNYTEEERPLEISAPYVLDLSITDCTAGYDYVLKKVSSVVRAKVYFHLDDAYDTDYMPKHIDPSPRDYMNGLFDRLHSVKDLELGPWCVEVLSLWEVKGWKLPSSPRSCLTLNVWPHKRSMAGIIGILKSSPNLETLVIKGTPFPREVTLQVSESEEVLVTTYLQNANLDSAAHHVKTVKISSFTESYSSVEPMATVVQLLLKEATVLEKIVISAKKLDIRKSARTLISFPRASSKAVILFD